MHDVDSEDRPACGRDCKTPTKSTWPSERFCRCLSPSYRHNAGSLSSQARSGCLIVWDAGLTLLPIQSDEDFGPDRACGSLPASVWSTSVAFCPAPESPLDK